MKIFHSDQRDVTRAIGTETEFDGRRCYTEANSYESKNIERSS